MGIISHLDQGGGNAKLDPQVASEERKKKKKWRCWQGPVLIIFSFFKTIIMFVLAACLVITSDHDCLHQHGILSVLRKQLRSRVGKGLLVEAQLAQTPARTFVQRVPVALGNISTEDCSSDVVNCKGEDPHSGGV